MLTLPFLPWYPSDCSLTRALNNWGELPSLATDVDVQCAESTCSILEDDSKLGLIFQGRSVIRSVAVLDTKVIRNQQGA